MTSPTHPVTPTLASGFLAAGIALAFAACGPSASNQPSADGGGRADARDQQNCTEAVETNCFDGVDSDCDGRIDCADNDCTELCNGGGGDAGVCGDASLTGDPLAIPDGVGMSYETTLTILGGFDPGQTLQNVSGFLRVCVNMEHSWLRDLQIELICPSGNLVVLQQFLGQTGSELYMGEPDDTDNYNPIPGVGYDYCWTPTAVNAPMLEWSNAHPGVGTLPPGDYQASSGFGALVGCELNGTWRLRATDDWGSDNGFIFGWSIEFDRSIITDCAGWEVE